MATNSAIGIRNEKGEIKAVHCHWDGYPDWVGRVLANNYNEIEKIEELLALGDLSSLGERVKPNEGEEHSFDKPLNDVTVAYHRDRGEKLVEAKKFRNINKLMECFHWCCYYYVFEGGEWITYTQGNSGLPVRLLLKEEI